MYGTMFRFRPRPERAQDLQRLVEEHASNRIPRISGLLADYVLKPDASTGEWIGFVVFESREAYGANAESREQDQWYRRFRAELLEDPIWLDGEIELVQPTSVAI